ncbi:hypothetical protein [Lysinibacillus capsici]|uniref:hypothetical protein n=1 Tax=Lysinibacillus capsici TaxID=2115968 RepID=UPI0028A71F34|nr:hypothetical protein [Lysinibacillus capsici]
MTKIKKNVLISEEVLTNEFPKVLEALQSKTDLLADSIGMPRKKVKETDVWAFAIKEAYDSLVEQGLIEEN